MRIVQTKLFLISLIGFLLSCSAEEKPTSETPPPQVEAEPVDTIAPIIDSLKPLLVPRIEAFFAEKIQERSFNGVYLFAQHGRIIHQGAHGIANAKTKDSVQVNSVFQLASISKTITATAIQILVDDGKLSLDDNIKRFIPNFPYQGITIKLLLTHRAGLGNYTYFQEKLWADKDVPLTNSDVVNMMIRYNPEVYEDPDVQMVYFQPNVRYDYSNTGYAILAHAVEKASGQRFEDFVKTRIFDVAGMTNSYAIRQAKMPEIANLAHGYIGGRNYRSPGNEHLDNVLGDKFVHATAEDLLKFDQALIHGKLVSDSILQLAYTGYSKKKEKGTHNYGLGWRILNNREDQVIYHTGWWHGVRGIFVRNLTKDQTVIVLDNVKRDSQFFKRYSVSELLNLMLTEEVLDNTVSKD